MQWAICESRETGPAPSVWLDVVEAQAVTIRSDRDDPPSQRYGATKRFRL